MPASNSARRLVRTLRDRTPAGTVAARLVRAAKSIGVPVGDHVFRHLPYRGIVTVPVSGGRFRVKSYGHVIENRLYWNGLGGQDGVCLMAWAALAEAGNGVILDIGSNTGLFALVAAAVRPNAEIVAFEPLGRVAELLRANVALNSGFNIDVREEAVADECGTVTLHDPGGSQPSSASLLEDFLESETEGFEVPVTTVDTLVGTGADTMQVDLAKIDVEGVEDRVLRGMAETIERDRPALVIEVLDDRPAIVEELKALEAVGYRTYDLTEEAAVEITNAFRVPVDRNLLAVPEERAVQLQGVIGFTAA